MYKIILYTKYELSLVTNSLQTNVNYLNVIVWFICFRVRFGTADSLYHFHSFGDTAKHSVFVVQPRLKLKINMFNSQNDDSYWLLTVGMSVIKNWLPFVCGPALAILNVYGLSCFKCGRISSSNSPPHILSPPNPVPRIILINHHYLC